MDRLTKRADIQMAKIAKRLKLMFYLRPTNAVKEKNKFLKNFKKNKKYNPCFLYNFPKLDILKAEKALLEINTGKGPTGKLLGGIKNNLSLGLNALKRVGTGDFTKYSLLLYKKPSQSLVKIAERKLKGLNSKKSKQRIINSDVLCKRFKAELKKRKLIWQVKEFKTLTSKVAIDGARKKVLIKKGGVFTEAEAKRLLIHEIGVHIFRRENGFLQPLKILAEDYPGIEATEEGLAVYKEEKKVKDVKRFKTLLLRVLSVDFSLKKSFWDAFQEIMKYNLSEEETFDVCLRAKRGLSDTSKPGGFTKDYLYFYGYLKVVNFIKNGGSIDDLYIGKVNIEEINLLKKIKGLKSPVYI